VHRLMRGVCPILASQGRLVRLCIWMAFYMVYTTRLGIAWTLGLWDDTAFRKGSNLDLLWYVEIQLRLLLQAFAHICSFRVSDHVQWSLYACDTSRRGGIRMLCEGQGHH
jgi:hypothetical protein